MGECVSPGGPEGDGGSPDGAARGGADASARDGSGGLTGDGAGSSAGDAVSADASAIDAAASVTKMVDTSGGTVTLNGATLVIPPGALSAPTDISIRDTGVDPPSTYTPYSHVFEFGPEGTSFAQPITVTLPFKGDTKLATLFWSKPSSLQTTGYDWIGGTVSGTTVSSHVSHFSKGFVANGVDYSDPPDLSCVNLRTIEGRTVAPSGVASFFAVDDCWGRPVTGLAKSRFAVREDGDAISVEAGETIIDKPGVQVFVNLMLDLSTSSAVQRAQLIAGAKAFVDQLHASNLPVQVGLEVFTSNIVQRQLTAPAASTADAGTTAGAGKHSAEDASASGGFAMAASEGDTAAAGVFVTLDTAPGGVLQTALDALSSYAPADPNSTNLNGAIIQGLADLQAAEGSFENRNDGGALTSGYVLVFTAGKDTSKIKTLADVQAAEATSPDGVLAVMVQGPDYDAASMAALAPNGVIAADDPDDLANAFAGLAHRIAGELQRVYLLGYCSPARLGTHTVSVSVTGATNMATADYKFDASNFGNGCTASLFDPATACAGKQCGGLACGACDDRAAACQGATDTCEDFCILQHAACGGGSFVNPNGYSQTCNDVPQNQSCGSACVDTTDPAHDWSVCSGTCADLQNDVANCGGCGVHCGGTCKVGRCVERLALAAQSAGVSAICTDGASIIWSDCSGSNFSKAVVQSVPVGGGAAATLATIDPGGVCALSMAAAAGTVYAITGDGTFWKVSGGSATAVSAITNVAIYADMPSDGAYVYFATDDRANPANNGIWKLPFSGGAPILVTAISDVPGVLRIDDSNVYWSSYSVQGPQSGNGLWTVPKTGGTPATVFDSSYYIKDFTVHAGRIYWFQDHSIYSVPVTGLPTGASPTLVSLPGDPSSVLNAFNFASDSDAVYFGSYDGNTYGIWKLADSQPPKQIAWNDEEFGDSGIVIDATSIYWSETDNNAANGKIMKLTPK
jgi:hypothetical protein